ncbi:MAG TPA: hypothetical protein VNV65_00175 [Candidatus Solibacter sp.]|jgi:hypothetical protein|nr:hypothetical protein [Candidatus Solibacter sp.]
MSFLRHGSGPMGLHFGEGRSGDGEPGIPGTDDCAHPGCGRHDAIACRYIDRRGRHCGYSWCPEHQRVFEGDPYCRRHGNVMAAITIGTIERIEPPDLDNRALSLCEWVANDLDHEMVGLLDEIKEGSDEAFVHINPLHLVVQRTPPSRTWARTWTLGDHTGTMRKIGLEVNESADTVVVATVDGNTVAREVPPWISDRGTPISEEAVQRRRDEFRVKLVGSIVWSAKNAERPWAPVS